MINLFSDVKKKDFNQMSTLVSSKLEHFFVFPSATYPMTISQIKERVQGKKEFVKMLEGDKIIGFANLYDDEEKEHVFIGNFVIDKAYREQGNGEKLINHMLDLAREKYLLKEIRISVVNSNKKAFSWYLKLGFEPYGVEVVDENMTFVHMQMPLLTQSS